MSDKTRPIRKINLDEYQGLFSLTFVSDLLEQSRIFKGDTLIVAPVKSWDEENLYVWQTPSGKTAKYAYDNFGDITLHNKAGWQQRFKAHQIKCLGKVIRVERDLYKD